MEEITEHILERMRAVYLRRAPQSDDDGLRAMLTGEPPDEVAQNLCAWDINCGWCEEWVLSAAERFGGEGIWYDEIEPDNPAPPHMVLFLNGLYYDSQTPHGVDDIKKMDVYKEVSREDFVAREARNRG